MHKSSDFHNLGAKPISKSTMIKFFYVYTCMYAGLIPALHSASERQRYLVTTSLIGWVQA